MSTRVPLTARAVVVAAWAFVAAYAVQAVLPLSAGRHEWWYDWPYLVFSAAATVALGARAVLVREERLGWLLIAANFLASTLAGALWTFAYANAEFSVADLIWMAAYPIALAGLALLSQPRGRTLRSGLWIDGVLGVLAIAALLASLIIGSLRDGSAGMSVGAQVANISYPVGDLLLVGVLVGRLALREWRLDRRMLLLLAGALLYTLSDTLYIQGSYVEGSLDDLGWIAAAAVWVQASMLPRPHVERPAPRYGAVTASVGFALVALTVLAVEALTGGDPVPVVLAVAALACAVARIAVTLGDNERLLRISRREAATDELTGLGNRRALLRDLAAGDGRRRLLVLMDLDGFKLYNDAYGHLAGDDLLRRIGEVLGRAVAGRGTAYRMGGDEFCALVALGDREDAEALAVAVAVAVEDAGGFAAVGASHGYVALPEEAEDPSAALGLADRRMYAQKSGMRPSAQRQSADVLLAMLRERHADLADHVGGVALLAAQVARELNLSDEVAEQVADAAALHDIGKLAIPDAILDKPAGLDEGEWALMRRHTAIGGRVVGAAPALAPVARMVRASHERWDGGGYPDGLAGEDIPIGARIIFVCDAFDAMTSQRPYGTPRSEEAALAELRACAGTQFDPLVVDAFAAVVERGQRTRDAA